MVAEMHMYIQTEGMGDATLVDVTMNLTDVIPEFAIAAYLPAFMLTTIAVVAVLAKFQKAARAGP